MCLAGNYIKFKTLISVECKSKFLPEFFEYILNNILGFLDYYNPLKLLYQQPLMALGSWQISTPPSL